MIVFLRILFFFSCRNIIHGSDGPETAKEEVNLWFKPEELVNYTGNAEKWIYGVN
jgi:nucleoside-diphosphate kinase